MEEQIIHQCPPPLVPYPYPVVISSLYPYPAPVPPPCPVRLYPYPVPAHRTRLPYSYPVLAARFLCHTQEWTYQRCPRTNHSCQVQSSANVWGFTTQWH